MHASESVVDALQSIEHESKTVTFHGHCIGRTCLPSSEQKFESNLMCLAGKWACLVCKILTCEPRNDENEQSAHHAQVDSDAMVRLLCRKGPLSFLGQYISQISQIWLPVVYKPHHPHQYSRHDIWTEAAHDSMGPFDGLPILMNSLKVPGVIGTENAGHGITLASPMPQSFKCLDGRIFGGTSLANYFSIMAWQLPCTGSSSTIPQLAELKQSRIKARNQAGAPS